MLSNQERAVEIKRRIALEKNRKQMRSQRIITMSSFAVCLIIVVAIATVMPQLVGRIDSTSHAGMSGAATVFANNIALGYIVMGLLSFVLGAAFTILCYRIHLYHSREQDNEEKKGA